VQEFDSYPAGLDDVPRLFSKQNLDVVLIDLDSDPEYALDLVESICIRGLATAMVYSAQTDPTCCCAVCAPALGSSSRCHSSLAPWARRWSDLGPPLHSPAHQETEASCWCFSAPREERE